MKFSLTIVITTHPTPPNPGILGEKLCIPGILGCHHLAIFQGQTQPPLQRPTETSDTPVSGNPNKTQNALTSSTKIGRKKK